MINKIKILNLDFDSISFDLLSRAEIEDTFADIPLQVKNIYVKEFADIISAEDLVNFHYQLWQTGKRPNRQKVL